MDMKKICRNQVELAKIYKWMKGEQLGYDPGEEAIYEWVRDHAKEYRERYNKTYGLTLETVEKQVVCSLRNMPGVSIPEDKIIEVVKVICDTFTEVWIKEVAVDEENNQHLDEI